MFSSVTRSASATAAERLRVRSALNPMLWLTAIVTPTCFAAAYALRDHPTILAVLIAIGAAPILLTCVGFGYFALTKPEKLQSEDYQLRHQALQMIQEQTGHGVIDLSSVTAIANPGVSALPPGGGSHP